MHGRGRRAGLFWLWALTPLLLATALTVPLLGHDGFNGDEPFSLFAAGFGSHQPYSLVEAWNHVVAEDPQQAPGWPMLLSVWTRLLGWSEVAVRALPFLAGILALACIYRAGGDLHSRRAGLFAALLLSASLFYLTYMGHARSFTLVALCATLCVRAWWHIVQGTAGRGAQIALVAGATGLLYLHYVTAMLLPALGLIHLLFVPKTRRWWRPVLLLAPVALAAALQLPGFAAGLNRTVGDESLHSRAMTAPELLAQFLLHLSNRLVDLSALPEALLPGALALLLVAVTAWQLRSGDRSSANRYLALVAVALLVLLVALNEAFELIVSNRIRYLMPLWPLMALLAGAGLHRLARHRRRLVTVLVALWLIWGSALSLFSEFRYEAGYFWRSDFHHVTQVLGERISASDFLAVDYQAAKLDSGRIYLGSLNVPWATIHRYRDVPYEELTLGHAKHAFLWLLYRTADRVGFDDLPAALERVFCERALDEWGFTLERYARQSVENCPEAPARLEFEDGIRLSAPEITVAGDRLRLDAHFRSEDGNLLEHYSLAVHVIDLQTGERVVQGDTGLGPGHIVPLRSEIDLGGLATGEYELRVGLYDWQSGARLSGRDVDSGAVGDMHTLHIFRIG